MTSCSTCFPLNGLKMSLRSATHSLLSALFWELLINQWTIGLSSEDIIVYGFIKLKFFRGFLAPVCNYPAKRKAQIKNCVFLSHPIVDGVSRPNIAWQRLKWARIDFVAQYQPATPILTMLSLTTGHTDGSLVEFVNSGLSIIGGKWIPPPSSEPEEN